MDPFPAAITVKIAGPAHPSQWEIDKPRSSISLSRSIVPKMAYIDQIKIDVSNGQVITKILAFNKCNNPHYTD